MALQLDSLVTDLMFQASAWQIPGISLGNVALDDAGDKITGISNDFATFTH